jgi:hypothetical protein
MSIPAEQIALTSEVRRQLLAAFLSSFGEWKKLEQMLLLETEEPRLEALVARDDMKTVLFDLLFNVMESQGKLPELVKAACRNVPRNQQLWDVAARLGWAPGAADTPGEAAASVRKGLRALTEMLREPEVNLKLQAFRVVFEGADRRIHKVGDFKDLHDRLHLLQLQCYSPILSARRDFPQGVTPKQLRTDSRKLGRLIDQLRAIVRTRTLDASDFPWIEEQLEIARLVLDEAIKESSSAKLETAIGTLTEVMQLQPTIINSLLLGAVRDLDLPTLHSKLQQVSMTLQTLGADDNQLTWFNRGVTQLNVLDTELKAQMRNHRAWQAVENNLRLVEAALNKTFEELEASWQVLQMKIAVVCEGVTDDWAKDLEDARKQLADSIKTKTYSSVFVDFTDFQTLAGDRFFNVDKKMKELCEQLRPLGSELDAVLQVME